MSDEIPTSDDDPCTDPKDLGGRPFHVPTEEGRTLVIEMMACDYPYNVIAKTLGISLPTLTKYYDEEKKLAMQITNARVMQNLLSIATTSDHKSAVTAATKWLAVKAGWRDPDSLAAAASVGMEIANAIVDKMYTENMSAERATKIYMDYAQKNNGTIN